MKASQNSIESCSARTATINDRSAWKPSDSRDRTMIKWVRGTAKCVIVIMYLWCGMHFCSWIVRQYQSLQRLTLHVTWDVYIFDFETAFDFRPILRGFIRTSSFAHVKFLRPLHPLINNFHEFVLLWDCLNASWQSNQLKLRSSRNLNFIGHSGF